MQESDRVRRFRTMAKALAKLIDFGPDPQSLVQRAGGDATCKVCGLDFYDHPLDTELHAIVACDGKLYKL